MLRKKGDVAVTLLVFMILALVGFSLYIFVTNRTVSSKMANPEKLNSVYVRESEINFYIASILSSLTLASAVSPSFAEDFRSELGKYKMDGKYFVAELEQLESQLSEEKFAVKSEGDKLMVSAEFKIEIKKELAGVNVFYSYTKTFSHEI